LIGKQQQVQEKSRDATGERAKAGEERTRRSCSRRAAAPWSGSSSVATKEDRADQGKQIGQGDIGQHNFQQAVE